MMNKEEQIIAKKLEEKGYFVEEQPKYRITNDSDEFLIQTDDLLKFYEEVLSDKGFESL